MDDFKEELKRLGNLKATECTLEDLAKQMFMIDCFINITEDESFISKNDDKKSDVLSEAKMGWTKIRGYLEEKWKEMSAEQAGILRKRQ